MNYNPTNFNDVVTFLGKVNKAFYGINPFRTKKLEVEHDNTEVKFEAKLEEEDEL